MLSHDGSFLSLILSNPKLMQSIEPHFEALVPESYDASRQISKSRFSNYHSLEYIGE